MLILVMGFWLAGVGMAATTLVTMLYSNTIRVPEKCTRSHGEVVYEYRRGLGLPYAIAEISKDSVPFYRARHAAPEPGAGLSTAGKEPTNGRRIQAERSLL